MVALQEELDWTSYKLYGLIPVEDNVSFYEEPPPASLGQRAFEIVMARRMARGELEPEWFNWLGIEPNIERPNDWPGAYRQVVQRHTEIIENNSAIIASIEDRRCKRR